VNSKATLSQFLRRAGLLRPADQLQFRLQQWRKRKTNRAFRQKYPEVALPPDYTLFESFQLDYWKYYEGGRHTAAWVWNQLQPHLDDPQRGKLLDWGCGPARVARHMPALLEDQWEVYGTDYNVQTVEWCRKNIKNVAFSSNQVRPPLPFANDFFHAAYGISIFTHLSEENHSRWLRELLRVSRPGAVLMFTTQGTAFRARLTGEERRQFDRGELVVRAQVKEGCRLFSAFHPPAYLQRLFSAEATILQHQPGMVMDWGIEQDTWVLRKG
jgi:SAM-dependent methyltransferase